MSPEALPDPVAFVAHALAELGGLVERDGDRLTALLPPRVALELGLTEAVELMVDASGGGVACGIGSPLLESLIERTVDVQPVAGVRIGGSAPAESAARSLGGAWQPRNGVSTIASIVAAEAWYLRVAIAWTVEADERHEGVYLRTLGLHGGEPEEAAAGGWSVEAASAVAPPPFSRPPPGAEVVRSVRLSLPAVVAPLLALGRRRQERDHERMHGYYSELIQEARGPRRAVEKAGVAAKVAHLVAERDARLTDLGHRYAARVSAHVAGALWMSVPVRMVTLRARRRKAERELLLRLPSAARTFDRLPCDGCERWLDLPVLCDDALHLLCSACAPEASGRPRCPKCAAG